MLKYATIEPAPLLRNLVKCYWVLESDNPYIHHSMADVCTEMVFHYYGRFHEKIADDKYAPSFSAGIQGPSSGTRQFSIDQGFGIFGVYFYPHAMPALFNVQPESITNEMPDLRFVLGDDGLLLEDKISLATDNSSRVLLMNEFLLKRLQHNQDTPVLAAMRQIFHNRGMVPIGQLGSCYFLSQRQFERRFRAMTGFTPKLFSRIVRFHSALAYYGREDCRLTDIAYSCGYYDQSHFIHDFRKFSGQHPLKYFSGSSGASEWRDSKDVE